MSGWLFENKSITMHGNVYVKWNQSITTFDRNSYIFLDMQYMDEKLAVRPHYFSF